MLYVSSFQNGQKTLTLIPIRTDEGDLRYIDFSHSNAYDVLARPFRTIVNNIIAGEQKIKHYCLDL